MIKMISKIKIFLMALALGLPGAASAAILKDGYCEGWDCSFATFIKAIVDVVKFLVTLGLAFSVIIFVYAGWIYLTSGGSESKRSEAHGMLWKALIGFLIVLCAFLIVKLITSTLGLDTNKVNVIF